MHAGHHAGTPRIDEHSTFATHRFTDEGLLTDGVWTCPQHCRMKLDEFNVDDRHSGTQCHRNTVTGDRGWVRGRCKHLTESARCDDDCSCRDISNAFDRTRFVEQRHANAGHCTLSIGMGSEEQIESESPFNDSNSGETNTLVECSLHFSTALISTSVDDAAMGVTPLTSERQVIVRRLIECGSESREISNGRRRFCHESAHRCFVTKSGTCSESVTNMTFERITGIKHRSKSTLCPVGTAGIERVFRDEQDITHRPRRQGCRQTCRTRPENDDIDVDSPRGLRSG